MRSNFVSLHPPAARAGEIGKRVEKGKGVVLGLH